MDRIQSTQAPISPLLQSPEQLTADLGGGAAAQMAAMLFMHSKERSKNTREQRDATEVRLQQANDAQVKELHEAADAEFYGALANGAAQIGAGVIGLTGVASDGVWAKQAPWVAEALKGAGTVGAAFPQHAATLGKADATLAENRAGVEERAQDQLSAELNDVKEQRKFVLDFLASVQQSEAAAKQAPWQVRA